MDTMRLLERVIMLRTIDTHWVEHLTAMENMRQGIGLEAAGQRDPLVQYKRVAYEMFSGLIQRINHDVAHTIFRAGVTTPERESQNSRRSTGTGSNSLTGQHTRDSNSQRIASQAASLSSKGTRVSAIAAGHGTDVAQNRRKVGRNEACPCGSGKKYKRCHESS